MPEAPPLFPAREYQGRVARLQSAMQTAGIDALLLTTPADIFYVTGFSATGQQQDRCASGRDHRKFCDGIRSGKKTGSIDRLYRPDGGDLVSVGNILLRDGPRFPGNTPVDD